MMVSQRRKAMLRRSLSEGPCHHRVIIIKWSQLQDGSETGARNELEKKLQQIVDVASKGPIAHVIVHEV